ncbi:ABC transporter ATP-binding protein [Agrobacterium larrymoorei]|uniref:ABC transporter ATP-binding protein n=1 Tax=Agrobacterium larrymoorei TaxID=160699 RepID=UPI0015749742|nr:ABC transporter ATP-binding protein [Agrobacterium larrymoorei]NTJ44645.1 ABC transporter ATP-binding protein [Agrobacterium larrymoorei]
MTSDTVLRARNLAIAVPGYRHHVDAVCGVDIEVVRGETLAIVGESGCGKSLTALALAGLLPDRVRISGGTVEILGQDVSRQSEKVWRSLRGDRISMIFQDPMSALNPVLTIGEQIVEAIRAHRSVRKRAALEEGVDLLRRVKLQDPRGCMEAYPHQLSGGMRQRVLIAMAIANRPDILIADEPTTALDATVQADILALLADLKRETGMALVLITHDLTLVSRWANRIMVMYAGKVVETREAKSMLTHAAHPYTSALLAARPYRRPQTGQRPRLAEIKGRVPSPQDRPHGCGFAGRCDFIMPQCRLASPLPTKVSDGSVWCHVTTERQGRESGGIA